MMRLFSALLALALLVATGVAPSVSYLCLMDGGVRAACCCKAQEAEPAPCPAIERDSGCCELQVSDAVAAAATAKQELRYDHFAPFVARAVAPSLLVAAAEVGENILAAPGIRAPPGGVGPPIFALDCRYLI